MNKSQNRALVKELDGLIQAIACLGRCAACFNPATCGHHLIPRRSMFYRHDLRNIVPLMDFHHTGDSDICAERHPQAFKEWMAEHRPEQYEWWQTHRNLIHKVPQREALLATRERLRAFLAEGKPYRWTKEIQNGNTNI